MRSLSSYHISSYITYLPTPLIIFFFFNDTPTTEIYTLSLHDALPIFHQYLCGLRSPLGGHAPDARQHGRSEEHTSELQSRQYLVCRLLLEKKKKKHKQHLQMTADGDDDMVRY